MSNAAGHAGRKKRLWFSRQQYICDSLIFAVFYFVCAKQTELEENQRLILFIFYQFFPRGSQRWPCESLPPPLFIPTPAIFGGRNYFQGFSQKFRRLGFKRNSLLRSVCLSVIKKLNVHLS